MLQSMQRQDFVARLIDADSTRRQQPVYAQNWHRSIDPAYAVLVGICTRCRCVPSYLAEAALDGMAGGYVCSCCASHYDAAGRAYSGIAQYNLAVPPYNIAGPSRILIGRNRAGGLFSLDSVERI